MSSENKDSTNTPPPSQNPQTDTNNYYQRKKNWISGVDNDMVLGLGVAAATTIASIAAFPMIKDAWERFVNRPQLPVNTAPPLPPPVEEPVIPPTPPNNGHVEPPPVEQPLEQAPPEQKEEEPDGLFHEAELRRKQKMMGQRPRNRYDSPFGKDIGGL